MSRQTSSRKKERLSDSRIAAIDSAVTVSTYLVNTYPQIADLYLHYNSYRIIELLHLDVKLKSTPYAKASLAVIHKGVNLAAKSLLPQDLFKKCGESHCINARALNIRGGIQRAEEGGYIPWGYAYVDLPYGDTLKRIYDDDALLLLAGQDFSKKALSHYITAMFGVSRSVSAIEGKLASCAKRYDIVLAPSSTN